MIAKTGLKVIDLWLIIIVSLLAAGCGSNIPQAKELIEIKDYEQALVVLTEEVRKKPKNAEAHYWQGVVHGLQSETEKMESAFERAAGLDQRFKDQIADWAYAESSREESPLDRSMALDLAMKYGSKYAGDEEVYYARWFGYSEGDYSLLDKIEEYLGRFPQGKHRAQVLSQGAQLYFDREEFDRSKALFDNLAREFADTSEGREAAARLKNWARRISRRVMVSPVEDRQGYYRWMDMPVVAEKGKRIRITASGSTRSRFAVWGQIMRYGPKDNLYARFGLGEKFLVGDSYNSTSQSGQLQFIIFPEGDIELDGSYHVTVEW